MCDILRQRWLRSIVRICYYHALFLGLMPRPIDWATLKFKQSGLYLLYSSLMHFLHILHVPLLSIQLYTLGPELQKKKVVLTYSEHFNEVTKMFTIMTLCWTVWQRRQAITHTFTRFRRLQKRCMRLVKTEQSSMYEHRIQAYLITKFVTANVNSLLIVLFTLNWYTGPWNVYFWLMRLISYIQSHILLETMFQFFTIFASLYRLFACINCSLHQILKQLRSSYLHHANSEQLQRRLCVVLRMHFECYQLAVCVLKICELPAAVVILKLFAINVNMLYHAVLAANDIFGSDDIFLIVACCAAMFFHYFDCSFLMFMIENMLRSCNETNQLVRELSCYTFTNEQCNRLINIIGRPKLRFLILGLFEFDKPSSLRFILTVILQVYALLQLEITLES